MKKGTKEFNTTIHGDIEITISSKWDELTKHIFGYCRECILYESFKHDENGKIYYKEASLKIPNVEDLSSDVIRILYDGNFCLELSSNINEITNGCHKFYKCNLRNKNMVKKDFIFDISIFRDNHNDEYFYTYYQKGIA